MRLAVVVHLSLFALLPLDSGAQTMYRCGSTYSQTPCAPDAKTVRGMASPDGANGASPGAGADLCSVEATRTLGVQQAQGLRVDSVTKGPSKAIEYAGQTLMARTYRVSMSYRELSGMFVSASPAVCYLSEDERRVLSVKVER